MKTLTTTKDEIAIKNCNEEWDNVINSLKEKQQQEIISCRNSWEDKRSSLIWYLIIDTSFDDDEISWLFNVDPNYTYTSTMPSNKLAVPFDVLNKVLKGTSDNIANWELHRIPADTHYKIFWWSIPICLIAWIWIYKAWIGIVIALIISIVRNVILEICADNDYQAALSYHRSEVEKFNQMANQLYEDIDMLKSNMETAVNNLNHKYQVEENKIKSQRDEILLAINNGIVTKYTSKSFGCRPHATLIKM